MNMEFVVDWDSVCLICLVSLIDSDMKSIFEKDEKNLTISEKIMRCSSIEIKEGMNLPQQICMSCYNDLNAAHRFRTNCESTNIILKSFFESNTNDSDVEVPVDNDNDPAYKFKLPSGLKIKRVKVKPKEEVSIKVERLEPEDDPIVDDSHQYEDDSEFIESEERLNEDDEPLVDMQTKKDVAEIHEVEGLVDGNLLHALEGADTIDQVKIKVERQQQDKHDQHSPTSHQPRRKGRPRKTIKSDQVTYTANLEELVENLTSVTYIQKTSREDGKPMKICEICGNIYKYQHALDSHMRRHRNEKPFSCEFCEKAFVANVELRRHMRVHTGQKPYACQYCSRRFSDFGSRIKHERTHTGERPYECSTCGKAFAYAHVLSVHVLTHTGEKKFKCAVCGKGFTKKIYLLGHMKLHNDTNEISGLPLPASQPVLKPIQEEVIYVEPKIESHENELFYETQTSPCR